MGRAGGAGEDTRGPVMTDRLPEIKARLAAAQASGAWSEFDRECISDIAWLLSELRSARAEGDPPMPAPSPPLALAKLTADIRAYFRLKSEMDRMVQYGRDPGEEAYDRLDAMRAQLPS